MVSRILGMLRDIVFGTVFGGSGTLDAFLVAFKIPNFFRRVTAEGAMTQVLLPLMIETREKETERQHKRFLQNVLFLLVITTGTATILTMIFPKTVSLIFAAGLIRYPDLFALTASMLRITFPYLFFITLTAYYMALQHSQNKFRLGAQTPIILNVILISAALWATSLVQPPIMALAWGVFIAGFMQFLLLVFGTVRLNLPVLPKLSLSEFQSGTYTSRFYRALLPAALSGSLVQVNLLADTFIASFLISGSISWLYFAERLIQLPIGVLGISLATVLMPGLSRFYQRKETYRARSVLIWGVRLSLLLTLPAAAGLILFAKPILATLFYHGSFTLEHLEQTADALRAYAIGVPAFVLTKALTASFFARQDYRTPLKIAAAAAVTGVLLSVCLVFFLKHVGLALATSASGLLSVSWLLLILIRDRHLIPNRKFLVFCGQVIFALSVLIASIVCLLTWFVPEVWTGSDPWTRVWQLLFCITVSVLMYFGVLFVTGLNWRSLNPRFE